MKQTRSSMPAQTNRCPTRKCQSRSAPVLQTSREVARAIGVTTEVILSLAPAAMLSDDNASLDSPCRVEPRMRKRKYKRGSDT